MSMKKCACEVCGVEYLKYLTVDGRDTAVRDLCAICFGSRLRAMALAGEEWDRMYPRVIMCDGLAANKPNM